MKIIDKILGKKVYDNQFCIGTPVAKIDSDGRVYDNQFCIGTPVGLIKC